MNKIYPIMGAPKVNMQAMLDRIVSEDYYVLPSGRTTICELTLDNGFTVRGEASVCYIENNVPEIGRTTAKENALNSLWPLFGFLLMEEESKKPAGCIGKPEWQQRVIMEAADLSKKIRKLIDYLKSGAADNDEDLKDQLNHMVQYGLVLERRIAKF